MDYLFPYPKMGVSFLEILHDQLTRKLLGFDAVHAEKTPFISGVTSRLKFLLNDATNHISFIKIGYTALEAFLQANVTGPPLDFNTEEVIFPESYRDETLKSLQEELFQSLSVDGSRPYPLTPHIQLFWLAKVILSNPILAEAGFNGRRARARVNFWHQKLLPEESPTLRDEIYADTEILEQQLSSRLVSQAASSEEHFVHFLIERAVARTYYGDDALARSDLARAATIRNFQFVLTGALGKRTKFQNQETSQLVVLAKSRDVEPPEENGSRRPGEKRGSVNEGVSRSQSAQTESSGDKASATPSIPPHQELPDPSSSTTLATKPADVPLNDDTLLEKISFGPSQPILPETMTHTTTESSLPPSLSSLDPSNPRPLHPLDSIILLATASSITNTSPKDGLVREETLPYATRVLDGGSSNWQVYTQALLVRSRIEGYRARTTERGLLQLQALVDQIIAETTASAPPETTNDDSTTAAIDSTGGEPTTGAVTTFFPKPSSSEAASVAERLQYVYQLSPPLRWELEAELAARWTHLGGLKTALEIYRRLQMHAEVALCLAATNSEGEAINLLKDLLFEKAESDGFDEEDSKAMMLRSPAPADAPRLLCILGDVTSHPDYYKLSWTVSGNRYARAQRSLARFFVKKGDYPSAKEAYTLALVLNRLDRASWFSLGCVQLELQDYPGAIESFTRCVQLEDDDAESWSNLGLALLKLPAEQQQQQQSNGTDDTAPQTREAAHDEEKEEEGDVRAAEGRRSGDNAPTGKVDQYIHVREALRALRRAATLKRDDARIWDNYLTVAAKIPPSAGTPWAEIIQAMGRVVDLRGKKEGEGAVDLKILRVLTNFITQSFSYPSTSDGGDGGTIKDDEENAVAADEPGTGATVGGGLGAEAGAGVGADATKGGDKGDGHGDATTTKLPYLARSFLGLLDTHVAPLATASPALYEILCDASVWRGRPSQALLYAEKSWRSFLTGVSLSEEFDDVPDRAWDAVVDKTLWMVGKYRDLGPLERERTGGQVEPRWKFKARSAVRKVLGRAKAREGSRGWGRLSEEVVS
ncbi:hypothetical protein PV08_06898 [Exophiala spinifera]|uniref:Uncharacterized protein n=1 Tax=Exophiala spinifera TaxID=91928 RepID=A0A0D1ZMR9_9EURO|nr:uncharacterized protein PV08_06898 [Exophiala spinifera]KIW14117.1 hypothetical protein PV08_06898 [Exophiala spinifera]